MIESLAAEVAADEPLRALQLIKVADPVRTPISEAHDGYSAKLSSSAVDGSFDTMSRAIGSYSL